MANNELLVKVLHYIEDHPAEWDQELWGSRTACGTTHCFAGHASVTFAGDVPLWDDDVADDPSTFDEVIVAGDDHPTHVSVRARELLDLPHYEAEALFQPFNTLENLRAIVLELIANGCLPDDWPFET